MGKHEVVEVMAIGAIANGAVCEVDLTAGTVKIVSVGSLVDRSYELWQEHMDAYFEEMRIFRKKHYGKA